MLSAFSFSVPDEGTLLLIFSVNLVSTAREDFPKARPHTKGRSYGCLGTSLCQCPAPQDQRSICTDLRSLLVHFASQQTLSHLQVGDSFALRYSRCWILNPLINMQAQRIPGGKAMDLNPTGVRDVSRTTPI